MINNKFSIAKTILVFVALLSFGTVIGVTVYFLSLKNSPPIAVEPTQEAVITPTAKPTIIPSLVSDCPVTVFDIDNNIYNTIQIGSQCWLKENLKVTKNPAGKAITRYCYNNDPKICETDGGLYDWNTAMNNSTTEGAQGICPNGWHVPKDSEWHALESGLAINPCSAFKCDSGIKLKTGGSSGFNAFPAGLHTGDEFGMRETLALFWSSTENKTLAWNRFLYLSNTPSSLIGEISRHSANKTAGYSLRCLKD